MSGDAAAIERVVKELCAKKAAEGVVYFEARYSPALFINHPDGTPSLTLEQVVQVFDKGLKEGSEENGVVARSILCCLRKPGFRS